MKAEQESDIGIKGWKEEEVLLTHFSFIKA